VLDGLPALRVVRATTGLCNVEPVATPLVSDPTVGAGDDSGTAAGRGDAVAATAASAAAGACGEDDATNDCAGTLRGDAGGGRDRRGI